MGLEKVEGLLACDGEVTLVAPQAVTELADYAREGSIRRSLELPATDARVERYFRSALPAHEDGLGALDAKLLFATRGEFERLFGRAVRPIHVARAMHAGEIHADVLDVLARVRGGLGLDDAGAELRATRDG